MKYAVAFGPSTLPVHGTMGLGMTLICKDDESPVSTIGMVDIMSQLMQTEGKFDPGKRAVLISWSAGCNAFVTKFLPPGVVARGMFFRSRWSASDTLLPVWTTGVTISCRITAAKSS